MLKGNKITKMTKLQNEISIRLTYINLASKFCIMTSLHHVDCLFRNDNVLAYLRYLSV